MRFPVVSQSSFLSLFDAVWLRCFKGVTESPLPLPFSCRLFRSAFWFFSPRSSCSLCLSFLPVPSPAVFRIAPPAFPVFSPVLPSCTFSPFSLHLYSLFILSSLSRSLVREPVPSLSVICPRRSIFRQEKTAALLSKNSCRHDPVGIAYASCAAFSSALSSSTLSRCSQGRSTSVLPKWP